MTSPQPIVLLKSTLSRLGGLEKYSLRLAKAFRQKGHPITLLTTGDFDASLQDSLFKVHSHPFSHHLSFLKVKEYDQFCSSYLKQNPCRMVFGLDRNRNQTHLRAGNGVHAAYLEHRKKNEGFFKLLSFSMNPLHRTLLSLEKCSFESPDLKVLFTNSHMVKEEVLHYYNVDPKKIHVLHNGVEWTEMQSSFSLWPEKKQQHASSLGLDPSHFHFLFIGHNFERKGLHLLLDALAALPKRYFHLSVIGKDKELSYYQEKARRLGLEKQVTFFGQRSDVLSFYQLADCLVIPSLYDPFANVTVEALAMGLFVVTSKTNGAHEVLQAENGVIISSLADKGSLIDSLTKALKHPKTLESAQNIRNSVQYLDFFHQLDRMIDLSLSSGF